MTDESIKGPSYGRPDDRSTPGPVAILGAGRAGTALSAAFRSAGIPVCLWWNRTSRPGEEELCSGVPLETVGAQLKQAKIVLLCVQDRVIGELASALRPLLGSRSIVLHTSGALPSSALGPAARGGSLGSWHPTCSFAGVPETSSDPPWAVIIEGDEGAAEAGRALAAAIGHPAYVIPAAVKARWHAATVLASNGLVALQAVARSTAEAAGLSPEAARTALDPLVLGTVRNLQGRPAASALTGPVRRGDGGTVERNLQALESEPVARGLYLALARVALDLAIEAGLDTEAAREVERALGPGGGHAD